MSVAIQPADPRVYRPAHAVRAGLFLIGLTLLACAGYCLAAFYKLFTQTDNFDSLGATLLGALHAAAGAAGIALIVDALLARATVHRDSVEIRRVTGEDIWWRSDASPKPEQAARLQARMEDWTRTLAFRPEEVANVSAEPELPPAWDSATRGNRRPLSPAQIAMAGVMLSGFTAVLVASNSWPAGAIPAMFQAAPVLAWLMPGGGRGRVPIPAQSILQACMLLAAVNIAGVSLGVMTFLPNPHVTLAAAAMAIALFAILAAMRLWTPLGKGAGFAHAALCAAAFSYLGTAFLLANAALDRSPVKQERAPVLGKYLKLGNKSRAYFLKVGGWMIEPASDARPISRQMYYMLHKGDALCFSVHPGAYGIGWWQVRKCPEPPDQ